MRLDAELLDGPPAEGARVTVLARLADAGEAATRLADPADAEALHDLRVALRRLRSTLRALGPLLPALIPEKQARRLKKAARLTGPARDGEVFAAWLAARREGLPAPYRGAHDWLVERVERHRAAEERAARGRAVRLAERAISAVTRRLVGAAAQAAPQPYALVLAGLLRTQAVALREAIREVVGPEDVPAIHRIRLEAKRLRYLLEPLRGVEGADASEAVEALKGLQDLVGEWHDAQLFRQALARAQIEAAADRARWRSRGGGEADFRPGLLALDQQAAATAAERYSALQEAHLGRKATALLDRVYAVVAALEATWGEAEEAAATDQGPVEAGPPPATERCLLLTGLPAGLDGASEEIEQGWMPGEGPRESWGLVRTAAGEQHFRIRSAGPGPARIEAASGADFETFWPLTAGRRIAKRTHLPVGKPGWRFDEFLDRKLVLAVTEAPDDGTTPDWLEPLLVREVTGERGYAEEALARRPLRRAGG